MHTHTHRRVYLFIHTTTARGSIRYVYRVRDRTVRGGSYAHFQIKTQSTLKQVARASRLETRTYTHDFFPWWFLQSVCECTFVRVRAIATRQRTQRGLHVHARATTVSYARILYYNVCSHRRL